MRLVYSQHLHQTHNCSRIAGYEVHVPALHSTNGARPPNAELNTDTALVRNYVESLADAGRVIIAATHSYGALIGPGAESCAKQGMVGGVAHLIYMCALALPEGASMVDKVKEFGRMNLTLPAFDFAEDVVLLVGPDIDEVDTYVSSLARRNGKCMYQEITRCV